MAFLLPKTMKTPEPTGEYVRQPLRAYPTQAEFLEKLSYDPLTGEIRWRKGKVRWSYRNPVLLGPGNMPVIRWGRRTFQAIRVAYIMHTGEDLSPKECVWPKDYDMLNFKGDNLTLDRARYDKSVPPPPRKELQALALKYDAWAAEKRAATARRSGDAKQVRFNDPKPSSKTKANPLPPVADLKKQFSYHPAVGLLRWKDGPRPKGTHGRHPGSVAGTPNTQGYIRVRVGTKVMPAHRIIWAIHYGEDPGLKLIDHIDGDPANNRIENLRLACHAQNSQNSGLNPRNRSGHKGVSWVSRYRKWKGTITSGGKIFHLGFFDTIEDAALAVKAAREVLHQEFARHA